MSQYGEPHNGASPSTQGEPCRFPLPANDRFDYIFNHTYNVISIKLRSYYHENFN